MSSLIDMPDYPKSSVKAVMCWIILSLAVSLMSGCSNKSIKPPLTDEAGKQLSIGAFPADLTVEPGDSRMLLRWKKIGDGLYSGYNIYIGEEPATQGSKPFNVGPYPGDTDPDDSAEYFEAENLINGRKYYVTVRVIRPDQSESKASNEVVAVCGPRGEIELAPRFAGAHDGYSFDKNTFVRADANDNDLYYYTKDGVDYLASPRRLGGYLRATQLAHLEVKGELRDIAPRLAKAEPSQFGDKVAVKAEDWILARTADNKNAVIKVLGFNGTGKDRRIKLYMAYCPAAGEMLF